MKTPQPKGHFVPLFAFEFGPHPPFWDGDAKIQTDLIFVLTFGNRGTEGTEQKFMQTRKQLLTKITTLLSIPS